MNSDTALGRCQRSPGRATAGRSRRVSPPEPETPLYEKPLAEKPKPSFFAKHYENAIYDAMQDMNQKKFEAIVNDLA